LISEKPKVVDILIKKRDNNLCSSSLKNISFNVYRMKHYVELFLVAIVLVLMYERPTPLVEFSNSTLGKILLVLAVIGIAHSCGTTAGILSAFIVILLRHTWREGLDETAQKIKSKSKKVSKSGFKKKTTKEGVATSSTTTAGQTNKQCSSNLDCSPVQTCTKGVCVSGTDQVGLDRQIKRSAETNTLAATSQENMHTG